MHKKSYKHNNYYKKTKLRTISDIQEPMINNIETINKTRFAIDVGFCKKIRIIILTQT